MKDLVITVTQEEINTIASGLAGLAYGRVYELVNKIQEQVNSQLDIKLEENK